MKYIFYEVVLPLLLVLLVYFPGGVTLLRTEAHLFEKVFSTGDLLGIEWRGLAGSQPQASAAATLPDDQGQDLYGRDRQYDLAPASYSFARVRF